MGLFDLLFKSRAARSGGKRGEKGDAAPPPDSKAFLVPRERASILPIAPPKARAEPSRSGLRPPSSLRQIVVTLGDVIARIPPEFLREGAADLRRELRFGTDEFLADIPRGRVTVALSNIAAQCPDAFRVPITEDDDREVRLPLQKLLDQLITSEQARPLAATVERLADVPLPVVAPAADAVIDIPAGPISQSPAHSDSEASQPSPGDGRTIRLSLAAILAHCPADIFLGERPQVDDAVQVTLPFEPIERQLTSAIVEISAERFVAHLSPPYAGCIHVREGTKIPLPFEEIFQNLPGNAPRERAMNPPSYAPAGEVLTPSAAPAAAMPPPDAAVPSAPVPSASEAAPSSTFHFFTPVPPHPRPVPPPPLSVRPIGSDFAHEVGSSDAIARELPLPPAEMPAPPATAAAAPPEPPSEPPPSLATGPERPLEPAATTPTFQLPRPPVARPLVMLPPPIATGSPANPAELPPTAALTVSESTLETTSDQTAVLEFLSGTDDVGEK